jgi:hypothetical protein
MSKKNNKKNLKKVQAKIGTTPVKAEAAKKEESNAAIKNAEIAAAKDDAKAKKKAEKKAHEEAKYAASKARIEARKARKKSIMDKLIDSKKEKASEPVKITLEDRLKKQVMSLWLVISHQLPVGASVCISMMPTPRR